jgi:DNA end-binding protein Ku
MPPRSLWRGAISFGIVNIPVRLFTATEDKDISFRMLHESDNARIRFIRMCSEEEVEIPNDEIVRGYEYEKGNYVVLTEEDFDQLPLPSKHTIELTAFVDAEEIDPVYYERSYYLEPEDTGVKPFALLTRALEERNLTALAKIAIRQKEQLCALRFMNGTLMLATLFYPDEIRVEEADLPKTNASKDELAVASSLIDLMTEEFDAEQYHDTYREALMQLIDAKLEGQEIVEAAAPEPTKVVDLMEALRASVEARRQKEQEADADEESPRSGGRGRRAAS